MEFYLPLFCQNGLQLMNNMNKNVVFCHSRWFFFLISNTFYSTRRKSSGSFISSNQWKTMLTASVREKVHRQANEDNSTVQTTPLWPCCWGQLVCVPSRFLYNARHMHSFSLHRHCSSLNYTYTLTSTVTEVSASFHCQSRSCSHTSLSLRVRASAHGKH